MLPTNLLLDVAVELTKRTREGTIHWGREKPDREHYVAIVGGVANIALRYHPSRASEDSIELAILSFDNPIGQISREEGSLDYDVLANLLFAIQIAENRNNFRGATDAILGILPEDRRKAWQGEP